MEETTIERWLRRNLQARSLGCWLGSLGAFVLGLIVLFVTFWFAYVVIFLIGMAVSAISEIVANHRFAITHPWRLALSGVFVGLLSAEWLRRSSLELGHYEFADSQPGSNALVYGTGVSGGLAMMLANPQASSTMITELLYTGPRLLTGAWRLVQVARRLKRVDIPVCAWALEALANRPCKVTLNELAGAWPDIDLPRLEADFALIPGTVRLAKGLSLTSELRDELAGLLSPQQ